MSDGRRGIVDLLAELDKRLKKRVERAVGDGCVDGERCDYVTANASAAGWCGRARRLPEASTAAA